MTRYDGALEQLSRVMAVTISHERVIVMTPEVKASYTGLACPADALMRITTTPRNAHALARRRPVRAALRGAHWSAH